MGGRTLGRAWEVGAWPHGTICADINLGEFLRACLRRGELVDVRRIVVAYVPHPHGFRRRADRLREVVVSRGKKFSLGRRTYRTSWPWKHALSVLAREYPEMAESLRKDPP